MSRTTTTVLDADGVPVVRHVAGPGPGAEALRLETEVLVRVRGPGVVEVVDAGDLPGGGARLATRYVPGGTLAHLARTDGEPGALAALAQVARTLDRLHQLGVVHGRCTADHVVGDLRSVALCGFSQARATTGDEAVDRSPDVAAFAALVEGVVTGAGPRADAARRAAADLGAGRADLLATAVELEALADSGAGPIGGGARLLHPRRGGAPGTGAPTAEPAPADPPTGAPASTRSLGRSRVALALALAVVLVAGAATAVDRRRHEPADRGPVSTGVAPGPTTTTPERASGTEPPPTAPPPTAPPSVMPPHGDTPVVDHDGARWAVGAPGDLVVVGDWDCDGLDTPAVVRPADGVVWSFPSWEAAAAAVPLGYVAAPVGAVAVPAGDGCDLLAVTTADGGEVVVGG